MSYIYTNLYKTLSSSVPLRWIIINQNRKKRESMMVWVYETWKKVHRKGSMEVHLPRSQVPNPKVPFLKHLLLATCTMGWWLGALYWPTVMSFLWCSPLDKTTRRQDIFNYKGAVHKHTSKCRHIYTYLYSDIVQMGS